MIRKIQIEHREWQMRNFGDLPLEDSLLGIMEELGELSHAFIKQKQHVRINEDYEYLARDAIGDIIIFLMSFCSSQGWDLESTIELTWERVKQRNWKKYPINGRTE